MDIRCPACRKINQDRDACQRCSCDLSHLRIVATSAEYALKQAIVACAKQDYAAALRYSNKAWQLYHSSSAALCAFSACLAKNNKTAAQTWYKRFMFTSHRKDVPMR